MRQVLRLLKYIRRAIRVTYGGNTKLERDILRGLPQQIKRGRVYRISWEMTVIAAILIIWFLVTVCLVSLSAGR